MSSRAEQALVRHLDSWFGAWPRTGDGIAVVPAPPRTRPTWDGAVRPLLGALRPDGSGALVVAPELVERVRELVGDADVGQLREPARRRAIGEAVLGEGAVLGRGGVLRWLARGEDEVAADVEPLGVWLDHDDDRVPAWLRPFGGEVLVALDADGHYAAGVGIKRHDDTGHELSVVTDEDHRGRGLARRLVATAARTELAQVPVVTYLHDPDNEPSARVAAAVGFRDRGWRILGVFEQDETP